MATKHPHLPPAIAKLPEPARTKAVEMMNALVRDGSTHEDAVERATVLASQWVFERAPGDRAEVPGDDGETTPDRPAAPPHRPA